MVRALRALVVVAITASTLVASQDSLRERARVSDGKPVGNGVLFEIFRKSIEDLTNESDVVMVAMLSRGKSYLTPNEEHIHTDYMISDAQVIAGELPALTGAPGAVIPFVFSMYGGEMIVEGVSVRSVNHSFATPKDGRHLLFLKRRGKDNGRYEVHHGGIFAIDAGTVKPLVSGADSVYPGVAGTSASSLVSRIEAAARK
jgi:hypothetical protein